MSADNAYLCAAWRNNGFTLLELLVVVGLVGLLALILMGGLRLGGRVWEARSENGARGEELRVAADFLRESLSGAYPLLDRSDAARPSLLFRGTAKSILYLTAMPEALGAAGLAQINLGLGSETANVAKLVVNLRRELALPETSSWPSSILLDGIQDVEFVYFGSPERGQEPDWHNAWESAYALPQLIRIRVTFPPGDKRIWPDFIVAPRVNLEATCSYDALTQGCRGR